MPHSSNSLKMNGDFEIDSSSQLCGLSLESSHCKDNTSSDEIYAGQESKNNPHRSSKSEIHPAFGFPNSFSSNGSKSNCRGDNGEDSQNCNTEQFLNAPKLITNNGNLGGPYSNDQPFRSVLSDTMENNLESMKSLSLNLDNTPSSLQALPNLNNSKSSRNTQFPTLSCEPHAFGFERTQSNQKFDNCNFITDESSNNPLSDSTSVTDGSFAQNNSRNQLQSEIDNPQSLAYNIDTNSAGNGNAYWNASGTGSTDDFNNMQSALSPILTNLLFQQSGNSVMGSANTQPHNYTAAAVAAASLKRAITGGHQNTRPGVSSRPPGWSQTNPNTFDSGLITSTSELSGFGPVTTSSNLGNNKPGWLANYPPQSTASYPWTSSTAPQQNMSKPNFGDVSSGSYSNSGNGLRFGLNSMNPSNMSGISANGFPKNPNSASLNTIYNMFPKRPQHRMMAHWQQQQHHQQHMQQIPGNIMGKSPNSEFSCSSSVNSSPYCAQESIKSSMPAPTLMTNQKFQHNSFAPIGQNPGGINSLSNNLSMGSNAESLNTIGGSEKLSLDTFRYGIDPNLMDVIKSIDNSGNPVNNIIEDMSMSSMPPIDNYHNNMHPMSNNPQQSCRSGVNMIPSNGMHNQSMQAMGSSYPCMSGKEEGYSRKVFVGGLPPDIDEEEITTAFRRFGPLIVDWPHKTESKAYFPPKGYCFLLFQEEQSVQDLISACILDESKYYWCVSSPTMKDKPVQIRPWNLADSDFVMDGSQPLDPRKTIFVGGVPRPLRAIELALIMDRLYGGVCYAGIDIDPELKYPKGAGRVAFSNQQSYIAAISARFVQLQHNDIDKRVEVKPYVLDNQMCDECQGARCGGKFAPLFCANVTCLQYYCEQCWIQIHSRQGREYHKPLVKEGAERPRPALYRW